MATKKKGCGFLITALILLLLGAALATILGMNAFSSGKEFVEDIKNGTSFITPATASYSTSEDSEATVWLNSNGTEDLSTISIQVTDTTTNKTTSALKPSGNSNMGNQHLIATFKAEAGKTYQIKATGLADGRTATIAGVSSNTVLAVVGKSFGAIIGAGIFGVIALIFGIIGLVKFFSSKNTPATT